MLAIAINTSAQTRPLDPFATTTTTAPTTEPASRPTSQPTPMTRPMTGDGSSRSNDTVSASPTGVRPIPSEYDILFTRSPFMKGRVPNYSHAGNDTAVATTAPSTRPSAAASGSDRAIVLAGVTAANGTMTAMLEDTSAGKILQAHIGDAAGSGKIVAMTLDGLDLASGSSTRHVSLGQTLEGGDAPDVSSRAALPTSVDSPGGPPGGASNSPQSILERMKAKRRAEMGEAPPATAPAATP